MPTSLLMSMISIVNFSLDNLSATITTLNLELVENLSASFCFNSSNEYLVSLIKYRPSWVTPIKILFGDKDSAWFASGLLIFTPGNLLNVVETTNGFRYVFNGILDYEEKDQWAFTTGLYKLKNVPKEHPIAILNSGKTDKIRYSGDNFKRIQKFSYSSEEDLEGAVYDF